MIFSCRELSFNSTRSHLFSIFHSLKTSAEREKKKKTQASHSIESVFKITFHFFGFQHEHSPRHKPKFVLATTTKYKLQIITDGKSNKNPRKIVTFTLSCMCKSGAAKPTTFGSI